MKGKKLPEPWGEPRGVTAAPDPEEEEEEEEKKEEEEEVEEEEEEEERLQERSSQRVRGCPGAVRGRRALRCPQHSLALFSSSRCRRSNRCRWVRCWGRVGAMGGERLSLPCLGSPRWCLSCPVGSGAQFLGCSWEHHGLGSPSPWGVHHLAVSGGGFSIPWFSITSWSPPP